MLCRAHLLPSPSGRQLWMGPRECCADLQADPVSHESCAQGSLSGGLLWDLGWPLSQQGLGGPARHSAPLWLAWAGVVPLGGCVFCMRLSWAWQTTLCTQPAGPAQCGDKRRTIYLSQLLSHCVLCKGVPLRVGAHESGINLTISTFGEIFPFWDVPLLKCSGVVRL